MGERGEFKITRDNLTPNLKRMPGEVKRFIIAAFEFHATKAEALMRQNARWTDRTGNARNGLRARAQHLPGGAHSLVLYHTMPYGVWLEVRWGGKYAVIAPTMRQVTPKLLATISAGLTRMENMR